MTASGDDLILDLRSGMTIWEKHQPSLDSAHPLRTSLKTDVVIVGAGITGSFIAERLTREGKRVVVLDRHKPQTASTAASTALLQWEIDAPMLELEEKLGFETAAAVYRLSHATVAGIGELVRAEALPCDFQPRTSLFFAGNSLDASELLEEHKLRAKAGLEGRYLDTDELRRRFGFVREAALLHDGSAEADPVCLARALLDVARRRGAQVFSPAMVVDYNSTATRAYVATDDGMTVEADAIVLANGYEMPTFVEAKIAKIASTWALATVPQSEDALWPGSSLVWEASEPYFYMRTTQRNEIIIGGEDEDLTDAEARDALLPAKVAKLLDKLGALRPTARLEVAARWAGFFSETEDGLPLIGPVRGRPRCYAAFGYGGNGITFSALAAEMTAMALAGTPHPMASVFAVERD